MTAIVGISNPSVTNPSVTNPSVTNPSVTNPSVSNPSVTNPSVSNPSVTNPSVTNPSVTNPSVPEKGPTMASPMMYSVPEISCEHCVTAITAEVSQVPQVASLDVDIDAKTVTVVGGDNAAILEAIDEAGYDASRQRGAATAEQQSDDGVVRVTKWTFPPGSETGAHVHEYDYVVVPVTNGDLTIETDDGSSIAPISIGVSYQRGKGVAHNVANDGDTTVAFVEVELLDR